MGYAGVFGGIKVLIKEMYSYMNMINSLRIHAVLDGIGIFLYDTNRKAYGNRQHD
jgi:hypothetical protein